MHRSATREQVMKHKCYDVELAFKLLRDQSAKVEREREREGERDRETVIQQFYEHVIFVFSMVGVLRRCAVLLTLRT